MKKIFFLPLLLLAISAGAVKPVVETGTTTTAPGIDESAEIGFAFAKGDVITIDAKAGKELELMLAFIFPDQPVGRAKYTKHPTATFTMPQDGIAVFRFVSDRAGSNTINYTITRVPASDAVQSYNTKVEWKPPTDHAGKLIPVRAGG